MSCSLCCTSIAFIVIARRNFSDILTYNGIEKEVQKRGATGGYPSEVHFSISAARCRTLNNKQASGHHDLSSLDNTRGHDTPPATGSSRPGNARGIMGPVSFDPSPTGGYPLHSSETDFGCYLLPCLPAAGSPCLLVSGRSQRITTRWAAADYRSQRYLRVPFRPRVPTMASWWGKHTNCLRRLQRGHCLFLTILLLFALSGTIQRQAADTSQGLAIKSPRCRIVYPKLFYGGVRAPSMAPTFWFR